MGESNWTAYGGITTALSTELNSLANGSNAITGTAINNSSNRDFYIMFELYLASVDLSGQNNPAAYLWLLKMIDGTNYEDGGAAVNPAREPDKVISLRVVSGAQRVIIASPVIMHPGYFHVLLGNRAGAALAAANNTLKYNIFSETTA